MKKYLAPMLITVLLTACNTNSNVSEKDYVGLTVQQAEQKASTEEVLFRVAVKDGQPQPTTKDYRIGRINATVENGVVSSYVVEGKEQQETYDQNSWKTVIADSCKSYFDGCNNCQRGDDASQTACTMMFCQEYQEPRCLD